MKPLRIQFWRRDPSGQGWTTQRSQDKLAPSWSKAIELAGLELGEVFTTEANYHRDRDRADFATIEKRKTPHSGKRRRACIVESKVYIVASVGELGWSP